MLTLALKMAPSLLPLWLSRDGYWYTTYRGGTTCLCTSMIKLLDCCKVWHTLTVVKHIIPSTLLITYSLPSICCPAFLTPLYLRRNQQTFQTTHLSAPTSSVSCNLHLCLLPQSVQWSKLSKDEIFDCYTMCVESKLSSLTLPDLSELVSNPWLIDTHLESIVRIFFVTAFDSIPIKKFSLFPMLNLVGHPWGI